MTTREQDAVIEALSHEHGAANVLPYSDLDGLDAGVLACGWTNDEDGGYRTSPWLYVNLDGRCSDAHRSEVAWALELADRRSAQIAPERVAS